MLNHADLDPPFLLILRQRVEAQSNTKLLPRLFPIILFYPIQSGLISYFEHYLCILQIAPPVSNFFCVLFSPSFGL